jgi:DNA-binding response OmpR family regulator
MASALAVEGFRVEWTTDPLHALDLLRDRRYALLVSDVNMPQMLGTRLAAEVRKAHPEVQVLLVTAFADPHIRKEAEVLGTTLLSKPVRVDALAAAARELLEPRPFGEGRPVSGRAGVG